MSQHTQKTVDDSANEHVSTDEHIESEHTEQYLTFHLADEEYGIEIMHVQGIQGWTSVTSIPNTPDHILGIINLRGQVVPIIDLRVLFSLEQAQFEAKTVVIVIKLVRDNKEKLIGMVVDGMSETYQFDCSKIQLPPDLGNQNQSEFLKGLVSVDDKLVILLNIDHLINADEINDVAKCA